MGNLHSGNMNTDLECPKVEYNPALGNGLLYFSPERALTAFAMLDRDDRVVDLAALVRGDADQFPALPTARIR